MADYANANNAANVSTTRGVVGGYFFKAPIGTTDLPTAANFKTWVPSNAWENQGYIPEDGFTEGVEFGDTTTLRDINLDTVDTDTGAATETLTIGLMEINARSLATQYGDDNVTDASGVITVEHDWSNAGEAAVYALLLVLKSGRRWVKLIRNAKVTGLSEFTGNKTTAAQRQITLTYSKSDNGEAGCVDFIESNDTPAPVLTTLSVTATGFTLTPAFAAATHDYSGTTTGNNATVTATSTGNTVKIYDANGNEYTSGTAITVVSGTNNLRIVVTDGDGYTGTYHLTVNK